MESVRPLLQSFQSQPQSMRKRPRVDSTEEQHLPKRFKREPALYTTIVNNVYGEYPVGTAEVSFNSVNFY